MKYLESWQGTSNSGKSPNIWKTDRVPRPTTIILKDLKLLKKFRFFSTECVATLPILFSTWQFHSWIQLLEEEEKRHDKRGVFWKNPSCLNSHHNWKKLTANPLVSTLRYSLSANSQFSSAISNWTPIILDRQFSRGGWKYFLCCL